MRMIGNRGRWLQVIVGVAVVAALQVPAAHPASAATVAVCEGPYSINVPTSLGLVVNAPGSDTGNTPCTVVNSQGAIPFGLVTTGVPHSASNGFTYTGTCVAGTLTYVDGGLGVFIGGIVVAANTGGAAFVGVVLPSGTPCQGAGTMLWSGVATYVAA
jgi:hypothetical protein